MKPTFKRLEVKDIRHLATLVAESIESIEPGLQTIDSRLVLGQVAIDFVGLDASGSLVLMALDFKADESLLLRVLDAYSWCVEYPDALRRLYPTATVGPNRPPRIFFIVERFTDAFMRRIRQLRFLEIDCLEFRHLEMNGASALYFDLVERLRRPPTTDERARSDEPAAPTVPVPGRRLKAGDAGPSAAASASTPVVPPVVPRAATPETPAAPPVEATPKTVEAVEPALDRAESAVAEPVEAEPADVQDDGAPAASGAATNLDWRALLSQLGVVPPTANSPATAEPTEPEPASETEIQAETDAATVEEPEPAALPDAVEATHTASPPAWAKRPANGVVQPNGDRAHFFSHGAKGPAPVQRPPAAAGAPTSGAPQPAETKRAEAKPVETKPAETKPAEMKPEVHEGLEALNFPKDTLSRQWLEFLNKLEANKPDTAK